MNGFSPQSYTSSSQTGVYSHTQLSFNMFNVPQFGQFKPFDLSDAPIILCGTLNLSLMNYFSHYFGKTHPQ